MTQRKRSKKRKSPSKNPSRAIHRSPRKLSRKNSHKQPPFKVGDRVNTQWLEEGNGYGDWYNGVIKKIDMEHETAHVVFDDGDTDPSLPWKCIAITK